MLGKLLKYELKAMGRVLLPLYIVMIAACGLFAGNIKLTESKVMTAFFERFSLITGLFMVLSVIGVTIVMIILIIQRFYKNLTGTEGYLMFTLPVTTLEHILSKMISAFIWVILGVIAGTIAGMLMISIFGELAEFWRELRDVLKTLTNTSNLVLQVSLLIVLLILGVMESLTQVYAAIAVGHQMNSHRLLYSVVAYLGLSMIEGALGMLPFVQKFLSNDLFKNPTVGVLPQMIFVIILQIAIYGVIAWQLLDKRLNLE